jgi:hypothetical protein
MSTRLHRIRVGKTNYARFEGFGILGRMDNENDSGFMLLATPQERNITYDKGSTEPPFGQESSGLP